MMTRLILIMVFLTISCFAQNSEAFYKVYPEGAYLADIDTLAATLVNTHPEPHRFTPKDEFWTTIASKKAMINDRTTFSEFIWMCSEIIANLNCSHSSLGWFNQESKILPMKLRFPLEARFIDDRLYVSDPLINGDKISAGAEIFAINGMDIPQLQEIVFEHINSQGENESYKRLLFNAYVTSYIPYAMGFSDSYALTIKGQKSAISLNPLTAYKPKPRIDPDATCQQRLCLEFPEQPNTALMTIRSFAFYGDKFPRFRTFIDESFAELRAKGITNLIIDLRMNDGGPSDAGSYLLQHLVEKPFTYYSDAAFNEKETPVDPADNAFRGNLYLLIDGGCSSTTAHFLSLAKHLAIGTLIGEEANANQLCYGGQSRFKLPNTGVSYAIGRNKYVTTATDFPWHRGIMPDHHIVQPIEDFLHNVDTVMAYTLALIKSAQ